MFAIVGERASAHYVPEEFIDGKDRIVVIGRAEITPVVNGRTWTVRELRAYRDWKSFPTSACPRCSGIPEEDRSVRRIDTLAGGGGVSWRGQSVRA
ncbi:hypothetical protein [Georgenia wangjunii]|uniref:hypothetical protein n=1 Tax=Georgenia wangjunii TaxID=3117730 RepID=UPI002F26D072